jgi:phosphatidylglycerol:prolipoprotein diacylglycerol transferase
MLPHLPLGPLVIPSYPFLALIGLWAGMWLAAREAQRLGIDGDHIYNIGLYSLLAGLLGGRAWYVVTHWEAYASNLTQALALTANAISSLEAVIIALIVALVYAKRHKLPLPELADAIAPGAALALMIGGVGAFLGSQTVGTLTNVPWGVTMFGQVRHPAHLYQVIATLIIFGTIWKIRLRPRWPGFTFLLFVELYAGSRLLLDPFFASPQTFGAGLRTVQVSALIVMVIVLVIIMRLEQKHSESQHSQVKT